MAREPDLARWLAGSRLNMTRREADAQEDPRMQNALQIFGKNFASGLAKIEQFLRAAEGSERERVYPPLGAP